MGIRHHVPGEPSRGGGAVPYVNFEPNGTDLPKWQIPGTKQQKDGGDGDWAPGFGGASEGRVDLLAPRGLFHSKGDNFVHGKLAHKKEHNPLGPPRDGGQAPGLGGAFEGGCSAGAVRHVSTRNA